MSDQQSGPFGEQSTESDGFPDPTRRQSSYPPPDPSQFPPPSPAQFPPPSPAQFPPPAPSRPPAPGQPSAPAGHELPPGRYEPEVDTAPYQARYPAQPPQLTKSKSSKKWLWLILIVPLFFALLIGGCVVLLLRATAPAVDATNAYVALLDDGELEAAYQSMCSSSRASTESAEWVEAVRSQLGDVGITDYNFSSVSVSGGRATVSGIIEVDGFGRSSVFELVSESGEWRVCTNRPLG